MSDPNEDFILERSLYVSNFICMIVYGMQILLFIFSAQIARKAPIPRKDTQFYTGFGFLVVVLAAIGNVANVVWGEEAWIEHRDFDGGPTTYLNATTAVWYQVFGTAAAIAIAIFSDTLLLWRCYIIWNSNWKVVAFPCIVYLASCALGIVTVVTSADPAGLFGGRSLDFGTPYFSLTIGFNLLMTLMICTRLLLAKRNLRVAGIDDDGLYTDVVAILAESASLTGISGIAFVVSFGIQSETSTAFGSLWGACLALSPQIIIYRILQGTAWSKEVAERASSLHFASSQKRGSAEDRDLEKRLDLPESLSVTGISQPSSSATKIYALDTSRGSAE